jgi:hypothetical protein
MLSLMKSGDYAFVEFGHNDQKQKGEGIGAFTSSLKDNTHFTPFGAYEISRLIIEGIRNNNLSLAAFI